MKLTGKQMQVLSDIIFRYLNDHPVDITKYNKKIISKLADLINEECRLNADNRAVTIYLNNLKRNMVLINADDQKILLNKNLGNYTWEFIWFMTDGLTGGGEINYIDLVTKYVLY